MIVLLYMSIQIKGPFFSVITVTKNSSTYLNRNINSVSVQTCKDFEHIFIDGKSDDGSIDLIKKYKNNNRNIRFFTQEPKGISAAMNEGIKKARGKYIIHLHSDDWLFNENILKNIRAFLEKNKFPDWIYGKICVRKENGGVFGFFPRFNIFKRNFQSKFSFFLLKYINFIPHQAVFIKKEVFQKYGMFDESITSKMDCDLWLRIADKTSWKYIDQIIANYSIGESTQSSSLTKRKENDANYLEVQSRHLNWPELIIARLINMFVGRVNKVYSQK